MADEHGEWRWGQDGAPVAWLAPLAAAVLQRQGAPAAFDKHCSLQWAFVATNADLREMSDKQRAEIAAKLAARLLRVVSKECADGEAGSDGDDLADALQMLGERMATKINLALLEKAPAGPGDGNGYAAPPAAPTAAPAAVPAAAEAETQAQPQADPQAETQAQPQADPQAEPQAEPEAEPDPVFSRAEDAMRRRAKEETENKLRGLPFCKAGKAVGGTGADGGSLAVGWEVRLVKGRAGQAYAADAAPRGVHGKRRGRDDADSDAESDAESDTESDAGSDAKEPRRPPACPCRPCRT